MNRGTQNPFTKDQLQRLVRLLRDTDIPVSALAIRFGRHRRAIDQLNRRLKIRQIGGAR